MTHKSKKEIVILIVLLSLLSISVLSQLSRETYTPPISTSRKTNANARATSNEVLAMDMLSAEAPEFSGVRRNIFQFGTTTTSPSSISEESAIPVVPPQTLPTMPPAVPEVHYLGFYLEKETGLKLASLSNSGRVYVGKTGQILAGKYQILEIAADHVVLKLLAHEGKVIRVPLGKAPGSFMEWKESQQQ